MPTRSSLVLIVILTFVAQVTTHAAGLGPFPPDVINFKGTGIVAVRPLATLLGAELAINTAGAFTVTREGRSFTCTPGRGVSLSNGSLIRLRQAPFISGKVLYVPIRPLVTALGGTIYVYSPPPGETMHPQGVTVVLPGCPPLRLPLVTDDPVLAMTESAEVPPLYVANLNGTNPQRLTYNIHAPNPYAIWSDGKRFIHYTNHRQGLSVSLDDVPGTGVLLRDTRVTSSCPPILSPDGQWLLVVRQKPNAPDYQIFRVSRDGTEILLVAGDHPALSPDGQTIAFTQWENTTRRSLICLINVDGTNLRTLAEGREPLFSPIGRYLLFTQNISPTPDAAQVSVLVTCPLTGAGAGTVIHPLRAVNAGNELLPAAPSPFSPDGMSFVFTRDEALWIRDIDGRKEWQVAADHEASRACFSPNGTEILYLREYQGVLCRVSMKGGDPTLIPIHLTQEISLIDYCLTPDGRLLVTGIPIDSGFVWGREVMQTRIREAIGHE